jgi:hypothetical protein
MISIINGEVSFADSLRIRAFGEVEVLKGMVEKGVKTGMRPVSAKGWFQHELGRHKSDFGTFEVEVTTWQEGLVEAVFLSHHHSFYDEPAEADGERRVFHEGVIARALKGQREFSWGTVLCMLDDVKKRDWLVLVYNASNHVPRGPGRTKLFLVEREDVLRRGKK